MKFEPEVGAVMDGVVCRIAPNEMSIELPHGIVGRLRTPKPTLPTRLAAPQTRPRIGECIEVIVLKVRRSKTHDGLFVTLGRTTHLPNAQEGVAQAHSPGSRARGKVVFLTGYGAFVRLESGYVGLLHNSELSWTVKAQAKILLAVGQELDVTVVTVEEASGKLSLSCRAMQPDPWPTAVSSYPIGSAVNATMLSQVHYGVFAQLEGGIVGLIHKSQYRASFRYDEGRVVLVRIVDVDIVTRRMSLALAGQDHALTDAA